ncbi:MAG TPA: nicotinate-nucleotide adenylyltransferase [Armatimonadota bacterium]|jgi:nicotinate-nucleotide adenylyltransferase
MSDERLALARRVGILGGTFDPIHFGHLAIAEEARERFALDVVLFIPTGEPPHKPAGRASAEVRYRMTELAIADNPAFAASRIEVDRPGRSYTVETLEQLHAQYPQAAFCLIMGADMAIDFPSWRDPEGILARAALIVANRPEYPQQDILDLQTRIGPERLQIMEGPGLWISSTDLRQRVREGRSIRYLVPSPVVEFICGNGLYLG